MKYLRIYKLRMLFKSVFVIRMFVLIRNSIQPIIFLLLFIPQSFSQHIIEKEITDWEFRMVGDSIWKKAKVPGTIIDNFVDLNGISNPLHPYYGDNEKMYQWIGEKDWEFRARIKEILPQDYLSGYVNLEFGCLDLFADVFINGQPYHHENAFYPLRIGAVPMDFSKSTNTISAEIRVILHSTVKKLVELAAVDSLKFPGGERVYARKPQYEFGWDWGPKLINMGIRKPVKMWIHPTNWTNFTTTLQQSQISNDQAKLNFQFNVNHWLVQDFDMHVKVKLDNSIVYTDVKKINSANTQIAGMDVNLKNPQLWWPNGLNNGKSKYYSFEFSITKVGNDTVLYTNIFDIPLCDIQLVQEKDKNGEAFYFTVNGKKVYAKGANYIPDDSFDPGEKPEELIDLAVNCNMNMIRVWGGGTYPENKFYDQCMQKGIMVWQDFMFACAMYPTDDTSLYNYAYESHYVSQRLNKFKNIAVWCGNNENEEGWNNWGWQRELNMSEKDSATIAYRNNSFFHSMLPGILDGDFHNRIQHANYIPTSPKHGWGRKESMTEGDSHYWGVWWGLEPIEKYNEKVPRFMSEFGMQAMPDLSTLKKVIPDSAMNFDSPKFKNHQKHPTGFQTLNHYLKEYLVVAEQMEDYAYATQILQSYALTTAIEAQRRAMPYCMGSLIWQLNDCWPVTSWSLVDYELKPKMAYYEVKEAYKPLMISVKEEENSYEIYIINDEDGNVNAELQVKINDFFGKVIWEKNLPIKIKKKSSKSYLSIGKNSLKGIDLSTIYMYSYLCPTSKIDAHICVRPDENYFHFVPFNKLKLPQPDFKITIDQFGAVLETKVYCPYVLLPELTNGGPYYMGPIYPARWGMDRFNNLDYFKELQKNPDRIKCLNTLLNH